MGSGHVTSASPRVARAAPLLLLLPILAYYLWWCVVERDGALVVPGSDFWRAIPPPTARSILIFGGWFAFQALLATWAPGPWVEGTPLLDGRGLRYRLNGWWAWWLSWLGIGAVLVVVAGVRGWAASLAAASVVADELGALMSTANVFTVVFCVYL